jgi:hypothetical protein
MWNKVLRIFAIVVIGLLCFAFLYGGTYFYRHYFYEHPLEKDLACLEGIELLEFVPTKEQVLLKVEFKDIQGLRNRFYTLLECLHKEKINNYNLQINNSFSTPFLSAFIKQAKLPIYEAISTGNFTVLPEHLNVLSKNELKYDLEVDDQFVFLTVEKGTDFAHLVICRESLPIKIVTLEGVEFY